MFFSSFGFYWSINGWISVSHQSYTIIFAWRVHNKKEHYEKNVMFLQIYLYFFILFRQIN